MKEDNIINSAVPLPDPRYWGAKFWFAMHTVAFFYPEYPTADEMTDAKQFYSSLQSLLPCPGCASHYKQLLNKNPLDHAITSRLNLMSWVNKIHNEVNRRLGKPIVTMDEYLLMNRNLRHPPLITYEPILLGIALALISIAIIRYRSLRN